MNGILAGILILCLYGGAAAGFQSDELDDEFVGVPPPVVKRTVTSDGSSDSKVQFPLEHSLGGSKFTEAGVFTARLRPSFRGGQTLVKLRLSRLPFSAADKKAFEQLVAEDGLYTIRVPANPLKPANVYVIASLKARCLAAADMKERFDFYMDQGNVIALSYGADAECPYPRVVKKLSKWSFESHIVSRSGEQATRTVFVSDLETVAPGDEALPLKKPVEKSFWAKYWMYVIPLGLIVMNVLTQIANLPEEQGAGTAQQQSQQSARPALSAGRRR